MGKTEKIVVLSVLFAVVVLFVWSLDQGDAHAAVPKAQGSTAAEGTERAGGQGPSAASPSPSGARKVAADLGMETRGGVGRETDPALRARPEPPRVGVRPHDEAEASSGLLAAEVDPDAGRPTQAPPNEGVVLRAGWDLVSSEGLTRTVDPEVFAATAGANDTWDSLAMRYYRKATFAAVLRRSNEGTNLAAGTTILVPAVDRQPVAPREREVEVLEGEGLWHVAERVLGSGARWKELHNANIDRIKDANRVKAGTMLRVP